MKTKFLQRVLWLMIPLLTIFSTNVWGTVTTYTFTSKAFADGTSSWSSNTDGNSYVAAQGVQCTTGAKGKATTKTSRSNVKQVTVIYCTNKSSGAGSIKVKIGSNAELSRTITKTDGTTLRSVSFTYAEAQTGTISVQGNTTTNSIWIYGVIIVTESVSATCNEVDVTGGTAVILPAGSTTYTTSAWKNNGSPTAYSYTPTENAIGTGDYCVFFTQACDANQANGMQLKAREGVLMIRHIASTAGVDISIVCSGTNGLDIELTGATAKTGQTGEVSIDTESTDATLVIKKTTDNVGYIKTISITPKVTCTQIGAPTVTATPGDQRIDLEWADQTGASSYTVTKTPSGGTIGTPSKDGSTWSCAITGLTNGTSYTWSVVAVGSGDYCDASGNTAASASATPNVSRTITYHDKDGSYTTSLTDGTTIATALTALYGGDDPVSCDATNYEYFVGWRVGAINGSTTTPSLLTTETVNSSSPSNNYYAVWSDTDPSAGGSELFNFEGGVASDLTGMTGVTASGLGTDYAAANAPYRVKLDGTGDYVIIAIASQPSKVTIGVKMIGGSSTSSITVQESTAADGTFTDVEELSISGAQNDVLTLETSESFKSTTRAVKLYFTKGSNVGLGPITIEGAAGDAEYITTCCDNVVAAPTVTATDIKTDEITLSWTHVTGANNYTVTCAGATIGSVQSSGSTRTCKLTGLTHNVLYSWSVVATYSEPYCDATAAEGSTRAAAWKNYYVDRMHGTNDGESHTVTISGTVYNCYLKEESHTTPTISDNTTGATACNTEHDHLIGWVVSTEIDANGLPILGYTLLAPGAANTATADGTIYYAIWGKLAD